MSFSKFFSTFLFLLLTQPLFLQTSFGADPLFHLCTGSEKFTAGGLYETQLKTLMVKLIYKAYSTGFGASSVGRYENSKPYGLVLCRGDVSASECKTCVSEAAKVILGRCPYNKGAVIWYDNCMFKYLDSNFFGRADKTNIFYMWNVNPVNGDPATFNLKAIEFLRQIVQKVFVNNPKLYASGEQKLEKYTLYGMAQCTRDLSSDDCKKCLEDAINEFPSCCAGKIGGRNVGASCNFRYELGPFLYV